MKDVFISHRTEDSEYADHLTSFLTMCGISADVIFCSSLPGNDVSKFIPDEIGSALRSSKYNIIILSSSYYESAYCQNEAGIIWFCDTPFIVFALPEIDHYTMQGFINSDYIIRRFDKKNDMLFFKDELAREFSSTFVKSSEKIETNIDKLMKSYNQSLSERRVPAGNLSNLKINGLEDKLVIGEFSDAEMLIFLFFYESQKLTIEADQLLLRDWLNSVNVGDIDIDTGLSTLTEDGYMDIEEDILDQPSSYKLNIEKYRELRSLSPKAVEILHVNLENNLSHIENLNANQIEQLIESGFKELEKLLIQYIIDMQKTELLCGWQTEKELAQIIAWENIYDLNNKLSEKNLYERALNMLIARRFLKIGEITSYNNPKSYHLSPTFLSGLETLSISSKEILKNTMDENRANPPLPFDF